LKSTIVTRKGISIAKYIDITDAKYLVFLKGFAPVKSEDTECKSFVEGIISSVISECKELLQLKVTPKHDSININTLEQLNNPIVKAILHDQNEGIETFLDVVQIIK
jgi:hypothetical protein